MISPKDGSQCVDVSQVRVVLLSQYQLSLGNTVIAFNAITTSRFVKPDSTLTISWSQWVEKCSNYSYTSFYAKWFYSRLPRVL